MRRAISCNQPRTETASHWRPAAVIVPTLLSLFGCIDPVAPNPAAELIDAVAAIIPTKPYTVTYNLPYGNGQTLDLYLPVGVSAPATVLYVPGGSKPSTYVQGTPVMYAIDSGLAIVSINYRRWSSTSVDTTMADIKAAMRYVRRNARILKVDSTCVAVWGSSAGAFVASLNALTCRDPVFGKGTLSECPNATVVYFSDEDLSNRDADLVAVGCSPRHKPYPGAKYDPIRYATAGRMIAPMRFEHGTRDCTVSYLQSVRMAEALSDLGYDATYVVYPDFGHGIVRPEWCQPDVYGSTLAWIKSKW